MKSVQRQHMHKFNFNPDLCAPIVLRCDCVKIPRLMCNNLAFLFRFQGFGIMYPRNESILDAVDDNGAHLLTDIRHIRESCKYSDP